MITFGDKSSHVLAQLHPDLRRVLFEVAKNCPPYLDFSLLTGYRSREAQNRAVQEKRSKTPWPRSKHNCWPAEAVDFLPYPFQQRDWKDLLRFSKLAGMFIYAGNSVGVEIVSGGDWDQDGKSIDERFLDLMHIELK